MARSDVYLYTDASDPANAVVSAKQDTTAADFPTLVLGDTPLFNFYFTDGTATWPSWAGDAGYSVTWALSDAIAGDESPMAIQTASTPITGGWSMRLPVNTGSLINALQSRRVSQAWPVVQLWSHIRVTDDSGFVVSYALIRTNVRLRAIPDSQQTPNDPLPAGTQYVLADETGALSSPANFLDASGFVTLDGGGKIAASQLPDIALVDYLGLAADEAAMLALSGQLGDWCIRSDLSTSWIITGEDPSLLAGWTQIAYPANAVTSVHGRTGTVSAVSTDYSGVGITGTAIGASNPSSGAFTTLSASSTGSVAGNLTLSGLSGTSGHGWLIGPSVDGKFLMLKSGNATGGVSFRDSLLNEVGVYDQTTDSWTFAKPIAVAGKMTTTTLNISGIPTSASGLSSGDVWSNGGVLTIV